MSGQSAIHWIDYFALPGYKGFRNLVRVALVALVLLTPVGCVALGAGDLFTARPAEKVEAIRDPGGGFLTRAELREAERLIRNEIIFAGDFPIWDAPADTGFYAIPAGDEARPRHDEAMQAVRQIAARMAAGERPRESLRDDIAAALDLLTAVGQQQGRDRAVVVYHRGLLRVWREDYSTAAEEATKVLRRVCEDRSVRSLEACRALSDTDQLACDHRSFSPRIRGVLSATYYLRGYAHGRMAAEATEPAERRRDVQQAGRDLANARECAARAIVGASDSGFIVTLNTDDHVVDMTTAPVWNDAIKVLSLGENGIRDALATAQPLIASAGDFAQNPELGATLALLLAIGPSESLAERRRDIEDISNAIENADSPAARQRTDVARALVGLQVEDRDGADDLPNANRNAFRDIHRGAAGEGENSAYFPTINITTTASFAQRLDQWLFIRQWRKYLAEGDLRNFQVSFERLRRNRDVDHTFFNEWRDDAMRRVSTLLQEAKEKRTLDRGERRAVYSTLIKSDLFLSPPQRVIHLLDYGFGPWWMLWALAWLLFAIAIGVLIAVLDLYRRTFAPHHHVDRHAAPARQEEA